VAMLFFFKDIPTKWQKECYFLQELETQYQNLISYWNHFVAPPRHKFVTGATLLQLKSIHCEVSMVFNICIIEFDKKLKFGIVFQVLEENIKTHYLRFKHFIITITDDPSSC
jgi:hypothetical protein